MTDLACINKDFLCHGVSGFDSSEVLRGRPFGGCAVLWRSGLAARVEIVDAGSNRICAIRFDCSKWKLLVVCVYMPYESSDEHFDDFCLQLSTVGSLIDQNADCHCVICGDFNVDFLRTRSHTAVLDDFCSINNLGISVKHPKCSIDYTYNFDMMRFSVLDHFLLSSVLFDSAVEKVFVLHDGENLSDHDPVFMHLAFDIQLIEFAEKSSCERIAWYKMTDDDTKKYTAILGDMLHNIHIPNCIVNCRDPLCRNRLHIDSLNSYACDITRACVDAANLSIPHTGKSVIGRRAVPGWKDHVEPARAKSILWHKIWCESGRPRSGVVADIMRRTRAAYHYAIRYVKQNERSIIQQRFAEAVASNHTRDLWSEVRKLNGNSARPVNVVDGLADPKQIADQFSNKFNDLYNSVSFDTNEMEHIDQVINDRIIDSDVIDDYSVSELDVGAAIAKLKVNKNDGGSGLSTNNFIYAGADLWRHIANLFRGLFIHGSVPTDFLLSTTVPIPKGRNANLTCMDNYRGITLGSVFGRLFDLIVMDRYAHLLVLNDLQFGFQRKRSTAMCTMVLKEVIAYYAENNSSTFCVFLDASKAFDRLEYCALFKQLLNRKLPGVVLRMLRNMYTGQLVHILWNGVYSNWFSVSNGVKQGGIISPILFCIYIDELLCRLQKDDVGCQIGNLFLAALAYADDLVLLAPTARAMRRLLALCDDFATSYNVMFNASKSKCIYFRPQRLKAISNLINPVFVIGGSVIEYVDQWLHLGHIIDINRSDVADIIRRKGAMIGQINNLLCRFPLVDSYVKNILFKYYCNSHFSCQLWDLCCPGLADYCSSWRKGLRRVWSLPYNFHGDFLPVISDCTGIFDELCRRNCNFVYSCCNSVSNTVSYIARHGVWCGQARSPIGRNVIFCANYFRFKFDKSIEQRTISTKVCKLSVLSRLQSSDVIRANFIRELLLLREKHLYTPGLIMRREELDDIILDLGIVH